MITDYRMIVEYGTWNLGLVAEQALERERETKLHDQGSSKKYFFIV